MESGHGGKGEIGMRRVTGIAMLAAAVASFAQGAQAVRRAQPKPHAWHITRVPLPGPGRGDYLTVDPAGKRLYVTHATAVHILDLDSLKQIAELNGLGNAHGVVVDPSSGHGFVTDGGHNDVVMFDPASGKALGSIAVGEKPDAFLRDPATGLLFAFNGDSNDVSVIDPARMAVTATIKLPGSPEFAQADGKGKLWVNLSDAGAIGVIDTRARILAGTIRLPGCEDVTPLAFDAADRLLFAGCGNHVMKVVDADAGGVIATVPIAGEPDGIVYDPGRKRIFVANRENRWTIVSQRSRTRYVVEPALAMDVYAKTAALDPASHWVFSSTATFTWPRAAKGERPTPAPIAGTFRLVVVSEK